MSHPWSFWPAALCVPAVMVAFVAWGTFLPWVWRTRDYKAMVMLFFAYLLYGAMGYVAIRQAIDSW